MSRRAVAARATARRALVALIALGAATTAACGGGGAAAAGPAATVTSRAPIAMTLPALDGGELDLASWRGRVVVIHVFTTWSMAATADVPQLVAADQRDDVSVVGLALDREGRTTVAPWRRALGVRYLVTLADDAMIAGHSPLGPLEVVPATIVLDRRGVIARRVDRPLADDELPRLIAEAAGTR